MYVTGSTSGKRRKTASFGPPESSAGSLHFQVNYDGGTRGNGRKDTLSGSGCVLTWRASEIGSLLLSTPPWASIERYDYLPSASTNNEAEYDGCIRGLREAVRALREGKYQSGHATLTVEGDSMLVTEQVKGKWACKAPNLQPLLAMAKDLIVEIVDLIGLDGFTINHVRREGNKVADGLANKAMDNKACKRTVVKAEIKAEKAPSAPLVPPPPLLPPPPPTRDICCLCSLVRDRNELGFRDSVSAPNDDDDMSSKPCCRFNGDPYNRELFDCGLKGLSAIRKGEKVNVVGVEADMELPPDYHPRTPASPTPRTPPKKKGGPPNTSNGSVTLSPAQRERMEKNKEEARKKREKREKKMTWL
ncbi:hypothetical protein TrRE_jg4504 [Triparma retinervis]|uniref:RNase H type-1 domain-containing protein n=1 Tax=Triparma retinervis TaxID=2557542 RepID=A0A9W7FBC8_9STRA|nr:hypothetical protein TrRE_jg4504 [Triparma retinervis]